VRQLDLWLQEIVLIALVVFFLYRIWFGCEMLLQGLAFIWLTNFWDTSEMIFEGSLSIFNSTFPFASLELAHSL